MSREDKNLEQLSEQIYEWQEEAAALKEEAENSEGEIIRKLLKKLKELESKIRTNKKKIKELQRRSDAGDSYY